MTYHIEFKDIDSVSRMEIEAQLLKQVLAEMEKEAEEYRERQPEYKKMSWQQVFCYEYTIDADDPEFEVENEAYNRVEKILKKVFPLTVEIKP